MLKSFKKKLRQGQSFYSAVIYDADTYFSYTHGPVGIIRRCRITSVRGITIHYETEDGNYYIANSNYFYLGAKDSPDRQLFTKFNQARNHLKYQIDLRAHKENSNV